MVTVDGKLYWMMDAYTTSSYYPYSEPIDGNTGSTNYIRNSVKVVVDAYNGDTNFYVVDQNDPIAATYQKIYPTLFKNFDEMPEGLKSHIRYPNYLFKIQASVYAKYHMEDVNVFYQREDMWDIASEIYGMEKTQMTPNYYIAKLPGEEKAEFFNSIPFTPREMTARITVSLCFINSRNPERFTVRSRLRRRLTRILKFPRNSHFGLPREPSTEEATCSSSRLTLPFSM